MRNSKKLIAVIMTVALLASMMVPALAASYQTQADKLTAAGLMKGTTGTGLDTALTRAQGIEFTVRAMGKSAAAAALTEAEVTAALANVTDAATIPGWARNTAAFAVSTKLSNGTKVSADGKITYSAMAPLSGKQFVTMMLRALGYTGITLDNCLDKAQMAGMLSASKVVAFGVKAQLTRDDAAYVIYETINNGLVADAAGITPTAVKLVNKLVADGALATTVAAANFTFVAPTPAPAPTLTFTAVALNLKQVKLTFNQEVNKDDVDALSFFEVKDAGTTVVAISGASLSADKKNVTLTLGNSPVVKLTNNSTAKVTVKKDFRNAAGVKAAADLVISNLTVGDVIFPSFDKVEAKGQKNLRVYFSEPVTATNFQTSFEIKSGTYTWSVLTATVNVADSYVDLGLGTNLINGNIDVKVKAATVADFAGLNVFEKTIVYPYVKDTAAPVATISSASPTTVKVKFNKPVYGTLDVYHSVKDATYKKSLTKAEAAAAEEWEFDFTSVKLPGGNVNIILVPNSDVYDLYGNKFVEVTIPTTVTADVTAPVVSSTKVDGKATFQITFDEAIDVAEVKIANYSLTKADGTAVTFQVSLDSTKKIVTIDPAGDFADLTGYIATVKKVKDLAGNTATNLAPISFTTADNTVPTVDTDNTFSVVDGSKIYLYFSEAMNAAMLTKANYLIVTDAAFNSFAGTTPIALGDNDTVTQLSPKAVLIDMDTAVFGATSGPAVVISTNVADLAGKTFTSAALSIKTAPIAAEVLTLKTAEATAKNMIKLTFNKDIGSFTNTDFVFATVTSGPVSLTHAAVESQTGKEAIIKLNQDMGTDATYLTYALTAVANTNATKTVYGTTITTGASVAITDKCAPEITKTGDDYNIAINIVSVSGLVMKNVTGTAVISFSEALDINSVSNLTFTVDGYDVTMFAVNNTTKKVTLTIKAKDDYTSPTPTVNQVYSLKDNSANGNVLAGGTSFASKYVGP